MLPFEVVTSLLLFVLQDEGIALSDASVLCLVLSIRLVWDT